MTVPRDRTPTPADRRRQVVTVLATVAAITANALANILPLNGLRTAEISDRFAVLVVPAGYVFSIWGVIYLGLVAFTIHQARPSRAADPRLRRLGYLPALTSLFNGTWIFAWHFEIFPVTILLTAGLLVTLLVITDRLSVGRVATAGADRWAVNIPWTIYTGWATVATIANAAALLSWAGFRGAGIDPRVWAVGVLVLGFSIAVAYVVTRRAAAYGLVIVWAYAGIVVKEAAVLPVAITAGVAALLVAVVVAGVVLSRRRPAGPAPLRVAAAPGR